MPPLPGRIYRIVLLMSAAMTICIAQSYGQTPEEIVTPTTVTAQGKDAAEAIQELPEVQEVVTADTGESLLFLGRKLAYEAKKRLNLTTDEEEKKEEKKKEYTLKFFGITYERK